MCSSTGLLQVIVHVCSYITGGAEGASRGELGMAAAMEDDRNAFGARREVEAADRKAWRADQKEALDELLPKATGRYRPWTSPSTLHAVAKVAMAARLVKNDHQAEQIDWVLIFHGVCMCKCTLSVCICKGALRMQHTILLLTNTCQTCGIAGRR